MLSLELSEWDDQLAEMVNQSDCSDWRWQACKADACSSCLRCYQTLVLLYLPQFTHSHLHSEDKRHRRRTCVNIICSSCGGDSTRKRCCESGMGVLRTTSSCHGMHAASQVMLPVLPKQVSQADQAP